MKVLIISTSFFPKVDGSTRCVYDHARKLVESGHDVYLVTRAVRIGSRGSFGSNKQEELEGIKIFRSGISLRSSTEINTDKIRLAVQQVFLSLGLQRRIHFDVIHVHGYSACYAGLPCKLLFGLPLVVTTHGTELLWPKSVRWKTPNQIRIGLLFEKLALRFCNVIIAQSKGVREYMVKFYGAQISKKIRIVPTGVDHEKFKMQEKEASEPRILFVGALSEVKGVSWLIDSFKRVHEKVPAAKLVFAGSGPSMSRYKKQVSELGLKDSVIFLGAVRNDLEIVEQYKNSSVVVLPSNVGGPISCTILEGLSSGRPVISTDVPGGIPDVINGSVGALIQRGDVDALTSELLKLVTDKDYSLQVGMNARRTVEDRYTLDSMVDELTAIYKELSR